jgi:hypothetical protein
LSVSGDDKKLRFYKEIERYKNNKKELRLKQAFLYPKFALRTCLCGTELLIKAPIWITLTCTSFASQAVKSFVVQGV